ncbi:hypothetical protein MMC07_007919 [Pseudocyphellaria aurata]|nr:hypothetical protein [Pseudocyphellaria aurata]
MKSVTPVIVAVLALATSAAPAGGKKQFGDTPSDTGSAVSGGAKKEVVVSKPRSLASLLGHLYTVENSE